MVDRWNYRLLSSVCEEITSGGAAPQGDKYFINGKYPFVRVVDMGNLHGQKYMLQTRDLLNDVGAEKLRLFPSGTILFTKSGASLLLNQRAILKVPMYVVSHIGCLIPNEAIISEWLYYWMKTVDFNIYAHATTLPSLKLTTIKELRIPVPTIPEQERIVARIEELFSQLDAGVETLKKTKAEIVLYRQAVFSSVIGKYDGVSKKLSDIAVTVDGDRGKNYPKKAELTQTGDCLFLTAANVKPYGWSFEDNTFISKEKDGILHGGRLQKNDVVITTRGTLGNVAIYDESVPFDTVRINSCMLIIRVTDESVSPYYLAQYLMSPMFKYQIAKLKSGTAQPQIPANILREIPLKIPSSNDQNAIIGELTGKFSVCDSIEQTVDTALQQAEAMRQSILKDAFEGSL